MKKFILIMCLASAQWVAGQSVIDNHFQYLLDMDEATNVNVSGKMFQLLNAIDVNVEGSEDEDLEEMKVMLGSITGFQLVAVEEMPDARRHYDKGLSKMQRGYEELISVDDKEGHFRLLIDEHAGRVQEVVGIGTGEDGLVVFSLMGDMELEKVGHMVKQMQDSGVGPQLRSLDLDPDDITVYPNPVTPRGALTIKVPETLVGGQATLYNASGQKVDAWIISARSDSRQLSGLAAGGYAVAFQREGVTIRKKLVVVD